MIDHELDFSRRLFTCVCVIIGLHYVCGDPRVIACIDFFAAPKNTPEQVVEMKVAAGAAPPKASPPKKEPPKKAPPKEEPLKIIMTAAPADPAKLPPADVLGYIEKWYSTAVAEMHRTGVPASISLAQGIVESHAGRSIMAVSCFNHFGMKCHEKHKGNTGHCMNFTDDNDKDFFLHYQNPAKSWRAHSELLCKGRYKKLHKYGKDWTAWANGLQDVGYATSKTYAKALRGIINQYKLYEYDSY